MLITAFAMPVLIGSAGLAVDTIQWALWKRQMQRAADSAAMAGVYAVAQGGSADAGARADLAKTADLSYTSTAVENAPTAGVRAGSARAVRVVLSASKPLPFSKLFLASPPALSAEATASIEPDGTHCMISLEDGDTAGIELSGNTTVELGCGVSTNSRAAQAITVDGSAQIRASPITAVGGLANSRGFLGNPDFQPYSIAQKDPFSHLEVPSQDASKCDESMTVGSGGGGKKTQPPFRPGCYNGADIKGAAVLEPGVYFINGGTFDVGAGASITGAGVTIILSSTTAATDPGSIATVRMNGSPELNLSAMAEGPYKGVLFYQDRRALPPTTAKGDNHINGGATSTISGALYFPSQYLHLNGGAGMDTTCVQVVGRRILMSGNSTITNTCTDKPTADEMVRTRVRLVG